MYVVSALSEAMFSLPFVALIGSTYFGSNCFIRSNVGIANSVHSTKNGFTYIINLSPYLLSSKTTAKGTVLQIIILGYLHVHYSL